MRRFGQGDLDLEVFIEGEDHAFRPGNRAKHLNHQIAQVVAIAVERRDHQRFACGFQQQRVSGVDQLRVIADFRVTFVGGVWRPLQQVEADIRRQSDALVATYERSGRDALIRSLEQRVQTTRGRLPYHVLVAPNGAVVAANLPDWPTARGAEWLRYEFGTYATGAEEEHEAVVRDLALAGGYRLLVGLDTEDLDERERRRAAARVVLGGVHWLFVAAIGLVSSYTKAPVLLVAHSLPLLRL